MTRTPPEQALAFRALGRRLTARRASEMGLRLWIVAAALAACAAAFTYWQVRVPLDGALRHAGEPGALRLLAAVLAALALAGGALAAWRRVALTASPPGPEWLALPVEPAHVDRHLAREARIPAWAVAVPAAAAWLAGFGLLSIPSLLLLAIAFALTLALVTRLACWIALHVAARGMGPASQLPAAWRALVTARVPAAGARIAPADFRSESPHRALARLDRAVSRRAGSPRARLTFALTAIVASLAAWFTVRDGLQARALAFAAFALACAELGAWAAWRAAGDPASAVRPLPLSLGHAWRARAWPLAAVLGAVLVIHALLANSLPPVARIGLPVSWALPALLLTLLGLHLGLSLAGRPGAAENLYYAWLVTGLVGSIAIPLLGWVVLIAACAQATRRLPRWNTPELA